MKAGLLLNGVRERYTWLTMSDRSRHLGTPWLRIERVLHAILTERWTREGFIYRLDEKASEDAWNRTLAWFKKYLTAVP
jgi:hypothetical protein